MFQDILIQIRDQERIPRPFIAIKYLFYALSGLVTTKVHNDTEKLTLL